MTTEQQLITESIISDIVQKLLYGDTDPLKYGLPTKTSEQIKKFILDGVLDIDMFKSIYRSLVKVFKPSKESKLYQDLIGLFKLFKHDDDMIPLSKTNDRDYLLRKESTKNILDVIQAKIDNLK